MPDSEEGPHSKWLGGVLKGKSCLDVTGAAGLLESLAPDAWCCQLSLFSLLSSPHLAVHCSPAQGISDCVCTLPRKLGDEHTHSLAPRPLHTMLLSHAHSLAPCPFYNFNWLSFENFKHTYNETGWNHSNSLLPWFTTPPLLFPFPSQHRVLFVGTQWVHLLLPPCTLGLEPG